MTDHREAAARWSVRLQDAEIGEAELLEFDAWLSASPDHRQAYDQVLETLESISGAATAPQPAPVEQPARGLRTASRREAARSSRSAGERSWWRTSRTWVSAAAGAAALAAIALTLVQVWPAGTTTRVYATARGQRRAILLASGDRLELNAETRVRVRTGARTREVSLLSGEAAFTVRHDPSRPFIVTVPGGRIRDLGTEFDVRARNGSLALTVRRGSVRFRPSGAGEPAALQVQAGQQMNLAPGGTARVSQVDAADAFGWRTGRLVLRDTPLAEVVEDLNPYFAQPLRIDDRALATRRVTGVLRIEDEASTVRRLAMFTPMRVRPGRDEIRLVPADAP
ncbi:MAG: FecR domain-containing protein [Alphaproteobacteria bacterium]|nr:FecR domain-containing protein [Alphaproteobacteria bacterium]